MSTSAELCRLNGWQPGTRLIGDEGYGPTVIRLTAVGETSVLAVAESYNGQPSGGRERHWTLLSRDWREVDDAEEPA